MSVFFNGLAHSHPDAQFVGKKVQYNGQLCKVSATFYRTYLGITTCVTKYIAEDGQRFEKEEPERK